MSDAKSGLTKKEQAERVRDLVGHAIESEQTDVKVNIYDESGKILDIVPSLSLDIVKDRELSIDLKIAHKSSVFEMDDSQHAEPDHSETQPTSDAFQESARTAKATREAEKSRNRERVLEHEKDSATGISSIHLGRTVHYPNRMDDSQHAEPDHSETQPASDAFKESARTAQAVREAEESRNRERVLEHEKDSATGILSIHLGRTVHYPSR